MFLEENLTNETVYFVEKEEKLVYLTIYISLKRQVLENAVQNVKASTN